MGSRDRDTKSLQDKLKQYFKKVPTAPAAPREELPAELERALSAEGGPRRLRAVRDLAERLPTARLSTAACEKVWVVTRDLLDADGPARAAALALANALAAQGERAGHLRPLLLRHLHESLAAAPAADLPARRRLLLTLTHGGRDITHLEDSLGPFLLDWLARAAHDDLLEALRLATNVVKFNAAYLEETAVHGLVDRACHAAVWRAEPAVVSAALALLEAVVCYSLLPRAALPAAVAALARTVNVEQYCRASWKVMRYVAGADLGYAALLELLRVLERPEEADAGLLRGAVFFVNMTLWGARRVPSLRVSYLGVLPALLQALAGRHQVVTYEVLLALQSLVSRAAHELDEPAWDALLDVALAIVDLCRSLEPPSEAIWSQLHVLISSLESLDDQQLYSGDPERLLDLVDAVGLERPEASALRLVSLRAEALAPGCGDWMARAQALADKYIRREPRAAVRAHTLLALQALAVRARPLHEDEVMERVALPALNACAADAEASVRAAAARLAAELAAGAAPEPAADLLDLLQRVLDRPFEMYVTESGAAAAAEADPPDVRLALAGLVDVFHARLLRHPPALPARAFLALLEHLETAARAPGPPHHPAVRLRVLELLAGLRVSGAGAVGYQREERGRVIYSPHLFAEPCPRHVLAGACCLPLRRAVQALAALLPREVHWPVVAAGLALLPRLLHARAPDTRRRADLDVLAGTLCAMLSDRSLNLPEQLRAPKPSQSEFHGTVLPALAALAPYHAHLEPQTQQRLVRCLLKYGVVLRQPASQHCISALTVFTLEARDTMVKMLPEVLLDLSKISDTKAIACPMLEFLSTLTRLPKVFASFVEDQYMSVFAILLPYTNPSRYNHYVVSLAHHVIAAWFLKCRLSYRRNFVPFIIHGLHNYIIMPFEEQLFKGGAAQAVNEDSSNRKRSSSLGSRGPRAPLGSRAAASASAAFHVELTETCVDLLARYTFSPCSVRPTRSATAAFLFDGGPSATWLVGHKLVTVTAAGCAAAGARGPPCERCASLLRLHAEDALQDADGGADGCWSGGWAEVLVRAPTGDVAWLMRLQNRLARDLLAADPPRELLLALAPDAPAEGPEPPPQWAPRSRCSSAASSSRAAAADLHKSSSSDSVVERRGAGPPQTSPINIPGSPQRASPPSPSGRPRHPVRRSNSSPEMSSSWQMSPPEEEPPPPPEPRAPLPQHAARKPKKTELRVSCEAIPEEVSGTPPRDGALPPLARSRRSHTISVMSPARRRRAGAGLAPAAVLLQLYHNLPTAAGGAAPERPLRVAGPQHERTVKNLDLVPPVETYKVGVLYVGPGQHDSEVLILRNEYGSLRYADFLAQLGALVELDAPAAQHLFLNLEKGGKDGTYTYVWHDDIMQVHFHVATAMPSSARDPTCNEKRKYIGNDHVSIVYNDSGADFNIHTIKGQLNFCIVVVEPMEHGINRVLIKTKDERIRTKFLAHVESCLISDQNVALLARQMALHCALASHISQSLNMSGGQPYASNSLERLRIIKRLRARLEGEREAGAGAAPYAPAQHRARDVHMDDFTHYT